jgi:hypothetical protein
MALPAAAEPVTMPEFEEDTVTLVSGPVRLLSACTSLSRLVALAWNVVKSLVSVASVLSCDCHVSSGPSAAVIAALTAWVTSMPGVDAPVAASRIWLRSMASAEFELESSEFNAETELISLDCSFARSVFLCHIRVTTILKRISRLRALLVLTQIAFLRKNRLCHSVRNPGLDNLKWPHNYIGKSNYNFQAEAKKKRWRLGRHRSSKVNVLTAGA